MGNHMPKFRLHDCTTFGQHMQMSFLRKYIEYTKILVHPLGNRFKFIVIYSVY